MEMMDNYKLYCNSPDEDDVPEPPPPTESSSSTIYIQDSFDDSQTFKK